MAKSDMRQAAEKAIKGAVKTVVDAANELMGEKPARRQRKRRPAARKASARKAPSTTPGRGKTKRARTTARRGRSARS